MNDLIALITKKLGVERWEKFYIDRYYNVDGKGTLIFRFANNNLYSCEMDGDTWFPASDCLLELLDGTATIIGTVNEL